MRLTFRKGLRRKDRVRRLTVDTLSGPVSMGPSTIEACGGVEAAIRTITEGTRRAER
jgi:hypothetical protein